MDAAATECITSFQRWLNRSVLATNQIRKMKWMDSTSWQQPMFSLPFFLDSAADVDSASSLYIIKSWVAGSGFGLNLNYVERMV
jgi:hypothetical protein